MQLIERFRKWYDYERDCNAKTLAMLSSVPQARRADPQFTRAVGKLAHMVAARHNWLCRLGVINDKPGDRFPTHPLEDLPPKIKAVEEHWVKYLSSLKEADLDNEFSWTGPDGKKRRWTLAELFTQVFGHAWYHRGQIVMLVKDLGGNAHDTDYLMWDPSLIVEPV